MYCFVTCINPFNYSIMGFAEQIWLESTFLKDFFFFFSCIYLILARFGSL